MSLLQVVDDFELIIYIIIIIIKQSFYIHCHFLTSALSAGTS